MEILKKDCIKICKDINYEIVQEDISISNFTNIKHEISVIFIDPPYNLNIFNNILKNILKKKLITINTIIVIESEKNTPITLPKSLEKFDERFYGKTKIIFVRKIN